MQLRRQDNVAYAAIGNNTTDATAPTGTLAASANVTDGDVVLLDEANNILTIALYAGLAADRKVRVAQVVSLANQKFIFSPAMTKSSITTSMKGYTAPVQQVTRIGYNGTIGALPTTTVKSNFFIRLRKRDNDAANRSQPNSLYAQFQTDATGSQEELAFGLVKNGVLNMSTQPEGNNGYIKFEAINGAAGTVITGTTTLDVEYGSKTVVIDAAVTGATLAVGSLLRFGTGVTDAVYQVAALTATTITLGHAYQGITEQIAVANVEAILVGSPFLDFGIQMTGKVSDFDVNAFRNYMTIRFTATFSDTTVKVTHVTGAKDGNGVWQEVAMDEYMSMGNQGENQMLSVPPVMRTKTYVEGGEYSSLMIESNEDIQGLTAFNRERSVVLVYGQQVIGAPNVVTNTSAFHLAAVLGAGTFPI